MTPIFKPLCVVNANAVSRERYLSSSLNQPVRSKLSVTVHVCDGFQVLRKGGKQDWLQMILPKTKLNKIETVLGGRRLRKVK